MTPLGNDPAPRPGTAGSWNVIREIYGAFPGGRERETLRVELSRDRAIDEAEVLADADTGDANFGVRFVVESADGLRRIEIR